MKRETVKTWCDGCGAFMAKQASLNGVYTALELAPGMVGLGEYRYGPGERDPRRRPRGGNVIVKKVVELELVCVRCGASKRHTPLRPTALESP